jgi:hypothetical protein
MRGVEEAGNEPARSHGECNRAEQVAGNRVRPGLPCCSCGPSFSKSGRRTPQRPHPASPQGSNEWRGRQGPGLWRLLLDDQAGRRSRGRFRGDDLSRLGLGHLPGSFLRGCLQGLGAGSDGRWGIVAGAGAAAAAGGIAAVTAAIATTMEQAAQTMAAAAAALVVGGLAAAIAAMEPASEPMTAAAVAAGIATRVATGIATGVTAAIPVMEQAAQPMTPAAVAAGIATRVATRVAAGVAAAIAMEPASEMEAMAATATVVAAAGSAAATARCRRRCDRRRCDRWGSRSLAGQPGGRYQHQSSIHN